MGGVSIDLTMLEYPTNEQKQPRLLFSHYYKIMSGVFAQLGTLMEAAFISNIYNFTSF